MTNDETKSSVTGALDVPNNAPRQTSASSVEPRRGLFFDFDSSLIRHSSFVIRVLFFASLCWCAHFTRSARMGFYEDDHAFAVEALTATPRDLLRWTWTEIRYFPMPQGRPIGFILGRVLPWIGYHAGGVQGMYIVGWIILSLNAVLFYFLLRRCVRAPLPLIGGIAFVFFPADTTRPFLCHAHILQPSITFTLLACHLYLFDQWRWRWRGLAYLFAACSLLTYETALLPFVVFPLLQRRWNLRWAGHFIVHLLALAMLFAALAGIRKVLGESRVNQANANLPTILQQIHDGTRIGIDTTLRMCRVRAAQGANDFLADRARDVRRNILLAALIMGGAVFASAMLARRKPQRHLGWLFALDLLRATCFGLAGLAISYVFCFTHFPPDFEIGRMTSTHLAATFPVAVLMAVTASATMLIPPRSTGALFSAGLVALYFGSLYAAAIDEQAGFVSVWNARRDYWTQVLNLCPDMTDRTLILCDGGARQPQYYMESSSWSDFMVAFQSYRFPAGFQRPPMCFYYRPDAKGPTWQRDAVAMPDGKIAWQPNPFGHEPAETVDDGNLILLHADDAGHVTRDHGTVMLAGRSIHLKELPLAGMHNPFPTLPLYHILVLRTAP